MPTTMHACVLCSTQGCSGLLWRQSLLRSLWRWLLDGRYETQKLITSYTRSGVTRLGVTRGGNWGCHPFFPEKNLTTFLVIASCQLSVLQCHWRPFLLITVTFIDFTQESPPGGCHPTHFYLSDLVCPLFFVNSPTVFFSFGCHPPWGCHPGRSTPPSFLSSPSDATVYTSRN